MSVSLAEQETTINILRDTDECYIYTSDTTVMTKLDKLVERSDKWYLDGVERDAETHEIVGKNYRTSKRLISFRADIKTMTLTDEQKAAAGKRLNAAKNQK